MKSCGLLIYKERIEMRYTKIKMEFQGYEDRFYRVVAIKGNSDLFKLCVYLLTAVR